MDEDSPYVRWLKMGLTVVIVGSAGLGLIFHENTIAMAIAIPATVAWFIVGWLTDDDDILT
jgi:hypothetical protein